jgi:hypothetical protein
MEMMATVTQIAANERNAVAAPLQTDAAHFVEKFTAAWARPTVERLGALMHPEVRLRAPLMSPTNGLAASCEEMRRLLLLWPDVRIEVERWSATGDLVFIEITMHATVAGRPTRIPAIDRILLRDGLVLERVSYVADPLPLLTAMLLRPSGWRRWWRSGVGPPRRPCRLAETRDEGNGRA